MGKKEKAVKRVVLDTNVLVSALIFRGEVSRLVDLWKRGIIVPVISRDTFDELRAVLEYPKFKLTKREILAIIEEEVLPYFEVTSVTEGVRGECRDPDDDKFIACAISASADFIVSGDKDLCDMGSFRSIRIITAADLICMLASELKASGAGKKKKGM